jgi:deazaflavin-dependent oxidoreductase (nitroreductase family)
MAGHRGAACSPQNAALTAVIAPRRAPGIPARALNGVVALLVGRLGLPLPGLWMLRTRGRRTGLWRETPVLVLETGGARYLVAPRGTTRWALNLRSDPRCMLVRGGRRRVEATAIDIEGDERVDLVAEYLRRYGWLTRGLFGATRRPDRSELVRLAERHPAFRLDPR